MGCPLYVGLNICTQLEAPSGHLCLILCHPHDEFGNGPAECLLYLYRAHPWALIQCNKVSFHEIMVVSPGGRGVSHPVSQNGDNNFEILQCASEAKEPIPQINRL